MSARPSLALPLWALLVAGAPLAASAELRAGYGEISLDAPLGAPLGGYGGLADRRAEGVLDPPQAIAVVIESGELRVALVSLDIVIARPELREALARQTHDLGVDSLTLVATHTHSGPGGYLPGFLSERVTAGTYDETSAMRLVARAAQALRTAVAALEPARVASGTTALGLARNRRRPDGPRETELPVLRLDLPRADPVVVFAYGLHPTVLPPASHLYSGDWVGAARAMLRERGTRPLFLPGPLGDQGPGESAWSGSSRDWQARAREIGSQAATAVLALSATLPSGSDPSILRASEHVAEAPSPQIRRFCPLWWLSPLVGGSVADFVSTRARFQRLRIGDATLIALPAEPGATLGDALRSRLSTRTRFVVAHANDWLGYAVDEAEFDRGGYEACMSLHGREFGRWLVEQAVSSGGDT